MILNKFRIDGLAISLSFLCVVHCLFVPSFIILAPSFLTFSFNNELTHYLILILAIPISLYALISGYKAHKKISFLFLGLLGLSILLIAVLSGEVIFGEFGEKGLTLLGSMIVVFAHFKNLKVCRELDCNCHNE
ncbi:MAG: MerC domain-containing protein [Pseudomonadota bacterium]|nr:MerC domain-containing protein [Pseudomonadota bacterium]